MFFIGVIGEHTQLHGLPIEDKKVGMGCPYGPKLHIHMAVPHFQDAQPLHPFITSQPLQHWKQLEQEDLPLDHLPIVAADPELYALLLAGNKAQSAVLCDVCNAVRLLERERDLDARPFHGGCV